MGPASKATTRKSQKRILGRDQDRKYPLPSKLIIALICAHTVHRDPSKPDGRTAAAKAMKGALGAAGVTTHKLGPKANQGAINAGLRALDRTGKQCRKWEKTGFRVKSFTGRVWEIPSWRAPTTRAFGSESDPGSSNTQSKENSSSNIGIDKSPAVNPSIMASSPAPGPAVTA